jgi:homoserine dehydrogenase
LNEIFFKDKNKMSRQKLKIGLFGFGCVGKGLYDVLAHTQGLKADIARICVKDKNKERPVPDSYFTFDKYDILNDESINVIVELIDDAEAAFEIVSYALSKGKAVVSANKKMIADHFEELLALQKKYDVPFLYEGAACASIPIIRNLEEYYDNDLLNSVEGIVNGSTNFILTKMYKEGKDYAEVLAEAQALGFAESNPALDVEGFDARYKLTLLAAHAFGLFIEPERIFKYGIQSVSEHDIRYAKEKGYKIKLVAHAQKIRKSLKLWVIPQLIPVNHPLYNIDYEYNGVSVEGVFSDKQFFSGKGAGSHPTASAVLSDISAISYDYRYEYKKKLQKDILSYEPGLLLKVYCRFPATIPVRELGFETIEQSFRSDNLNYVIGKVNLDTLSKSGILENPDVFLAQVGEVSELGSEGVHQNLRELIPARINAIAYN